MKSFSIKIKTLRKEHKKTQQNIADLLNIRRSTYGEYERGKILPPMDKMKILAEYFNVSVDYLIGNVENKETEQIDISENLKKALLHLKKDHDLLFNGTPLNNEAREILISSLENGLKMANVISNSKQN